ncbi:PREDICTED: leucine-rich repeat-containing protein 70 [Gekko japonicus]|uniref:Leucine-rich repeat-containing protein 70 n=1 Tax=Gekko japonicus TaxID=146911 RepID=A0ABM1KDT2_GEKJA|nr:PREDICTED: leucine-rich repeat-containing protein 70 [Gekko japonicus]
MIGRITVQDMCRLHHLGSFRHILNCLLLLLIQEEILCCPSVCQQCTGRQANCRNAGLSSIPKNFPQSTIFIYLSGNNISCINPNELIGLQHLAVLHLDNSGILNVYPKAFSKSKNLWYLHLNNNQIKRLDPGTFEGLSNLRSLYLQNNNIAFVPRGLFSDLTSVRYLTLQSNRLSILGSGTFLGMISLRVLNLANNQISRISDAAFCHLDNLTCLYLESNNLTRVPPNAFVALSSLEKLSLSHNPIGSVPPFAFRGLDKLKYLSLKRANINFIDVNGFGGLIHLKKLVLSNNNIENVNSDTFALLNNLMFLQLDRNKIINIADNAFAKIGASLKMLNLAFNNLTDMQPGVLKPLVSLTHLQAKYNPWNCSCRLLGLITWLVSSSVSVNIHCQYPSSLRGRHLNFAKWDLFPNCFNSSTPPETIKDIKPAGIHHSTTTLLMAWDKNPSSSSVYRHLKNVDADTVSLWTEIPTTSANQHLSEEHSVGKFRLATTVFSLLTVEIPAQNIPVNFTMEESGAFPPEAASVSFKSSLICTQQVEKLTRAFDILLTLFILACAVIFFLIYKMIQFRQKLKMQKSSDSGIDYYGFYQAGRYRVTDPLQSVPQNPLGSSELDNIHLPKATTVLESSAQVILFEHSAL